MEQLGGRVTGSAVRKPPLSRPARKSALNVHRLDLAPRPRGRVDTDNVEIEVRLNDDETLDEFALTDALADVRAVDFKGLIWSEPLVTKSVTSPRTSLGPDTATFHRNRTSRFVGLCTLIAVK